MKRSNKWFIMGCVGFLAILVGLVGWFAPSNESAEDPTDNPTTSTTEPSSDSEKNAPRPFVLSGELKSNITKVLRVYYASPSQRKETSGSVKPLTTADFADILAHQWDGLMPGTKVVMKKLKFTGAAVIDGERRVNATVTIVTTYVDKSKATEQWSTTLTLTQDNRVSDLEDYPDEGVG